MDTDAIVPETEIKDSPVGAGGFEVYDANTVNWVVRKIVAARAYADHVEQWAAAEVQKARNEEAWFLRRFGNEMQEWVKGELVARASRSRSIKLPAGQIGFRATSPSLHVTDARALLDWCHQHLPEALTLRIESRGREACLLHELVSAHPLEAIRHQDVLIGELKKHFDQTGELPPGAALRASEDRFFVK